MKAPEVILAVDVSPRWLFGHTLLQPTRTDRELKAMAIAHERIGCLMRLFSDNRPGMIPPIVVESEHLERLSLTGLRNKTLGLCGVYGDECVARVYWELCDRRFLAVVLEDACLWSIPLSLLLDVDYEDPIRGGGYYSTKVARMERGRALKFWPQLERWSFPDLWSGAPPSL